MSRPIPEEINRPFARSARPERLCQQPGCELAGEHRAPASPDRLEDYLWFCLDHVRDYNRKWNYFAGLSESEIERIRRHDTVWQRPSWPLGRFGERGSYNGHYRVHDDFGFFFGGETPERPQRPRTEKEKALAALDLAEPVSFAEIKVRYKALVKKLHPDANGGDRAAEEHLKVINQAYATLKISFA